MSNIIQMDLFQRILKRDAVAFCGVMYCNNHFQFKEGPAYLLDLEADSPSIYSDNILEAISSNKRFSVDDSIRSEDWIPTHNKGTSLVRLFKINDKNKGFVVFGINNEPLFDCPKNKKDCIISLKGGKVNYRNPPEHLESLKLGSILQKFYFCHNLNGDIILPLPISTEAKDHLKDISNKRLDLAKGQISKGDFNKWVLQSSERMFFKKFGTEDPEYLQLLLHLDEAGITNKGLECMTVPEKQKIDHITTMICQNLIKPFKGRASSNEPGPEDP